MMNERNVQQRFWEEDIHTKIVILSEYDFRLNNEKTPYEMWHGRPATVKHFKFFGSRCYIKRIDEKLGKFDARVDEDIFFWDIHTTSKDTYAITKTPRGSLTILMSRWMKTLSMKRDNML